VIKTINGIIIPSQVGGSFMDDTTVG